MALRRRLRSRTTRCEWKVEHRLIDVLVIAVCAVLGEAESFEDIALYAHGTGPLPPGVEGGLDAQTVYRD